MGILSSIGDSIKGLFRGSERPAQKTTSTTTPNVPGFLSSYQKALAGAGKSLLKQEYQPFTGQRVAGLTDPQLRGIRYASDMATQWQPQFSQATEAASRAAQPFSSGALQQFQNPYDEQVLDVMQERGMRAFHGPGGVLEGIRDEFVGMGGPGSFGSQRHMDTTARAGVDFGERLAEQVGEFQHRGFDTAMGAYGDWTDRARTGAETMGGLAGQRQALDLGTTGMLTGAGGMLQEQEQRGFDVDYGDYLDEREWPFRTAEAGANVMRGQAVPIGTTTVGKVPGGYEPSFAQTAIGTGLGAFALGAKPGAAAGLGILAGLSDRLLKSNVKRIGTHPLGIGWYEYEIDGRREEGVMADEVLEVRPEAVGVTDEGYLMVDYGMLN